MNVAHAKATAREWIEANSDQWPGLRAAHLVGGTTTMPEDAPFPPTKDLDVHLIFDEGSPNLESTGPFPNIIEVHHGGIAIEAGVKPVTDYRSPEVVLANPEIAHHLTVDSVLYDPSGLLHDLQVEVKRDYARRRWVLARIEFERRALMGILEMVPMAGSLYGASGEVNMLGYSTTRLNAALYDAMLRAPQMGSRMLVRLREILAELGRLDLHEEVLGMLGVRHLRPEQVERLLNEGAEAFDLAVRVRRSPHGFQHKLKRHLRPYFVDSCRKMVAEGFHREACSWALPYVLSTADVIVADGPEEAKAKYARRQENFLMQLGLNTASARKARFEQANRVYDQVFALAHEVVASNPNIID